MKPNSALRTVKLLHTLVWAGFVGCIVAIPLAALQNDFPTAIGLIGIVLVEVTVLAVNGRRCPLTSVASRYTTDRQANFDIYLPLWLARHNQAVFGTLFAAGSLFVLLRWLVVGSSAPR